MAIDIKKFQQELDEAKAFLSTLPGAEPVSACLQSMGSELLRKPRTLFGLTFPEWVVAVALVGVLSALALPIISSGMAQAREQAARTNASRR